MAKEALISVMKRYELKYRLSKENVALFKEEISKYMKMDEYGLTSIASLYFDTPDFLLINRSIEKPSFKEKVRVRSYGLGKPGKPVFLEVKRKFEKVVYKRRISLLEQDVDAFLDGRLKEDKSQIAKELSFLKERYGRLEPKYLIIYDRIAYYRENSDLRLTLDINPRYRVKDLNLHTSLEGIPLLNEGEAILEIKVQYSVPLWLVAILTKLKIYQTSFSKVGTAHKLEKGKNTINIDLNYQELKGGKNHELSIQNLA